MESPKMSFKGYKPSMNLVSTLKNCAYILIPAVILELQGQDLLVTGIGSVVATSILKSIEYWIKKK